MLNNSSMLFAIDLAEIVSVGKVLIALVMKIFDKLKSELCIPMGKPNLATFFSMTKSILSLLSERV